MKLQFIILLLGAFLNIQESKAECDNKIVIVFDISGSMNGQRLAKAKIALKDWLEYSVPDGTEIGLVPFNSQAQISRGFALTSLSPSTLVMMKSKIDSLTASGQTCIGAGFQAAIQQSTLFNNQNGGTILLIGDGQNGCSSPSLATTRSLCLIRRKTVFALNVGMSLDSGIKSITDATKGKIFDMPDEMDQDDFNGVLKEVCNDECEKEFPYPVSCKEFCYGIVTKQCAGAPTTSSCNPTTNAVNIRQFCQTKGKQRCDRDCKHMAGFLGSTLPKQCYEYFVLGDKSRKFSSTTSTIFTDSKRTLSGKKQSPDWQGYGYYRVMGDAGSKLAYFDDKATANRSNRCGAPVTRYLTSRGYSSRRLPRNAGEAGYVYAVRDYGTKKSYESIHVYNCGDFFVYRLYDANPSTTQMRWCTV